MIYIENLMINMNGCEEISSLLSSNNVSVPCLEKQLVDNRFNNMTLKISLDYRSL